MISIIIPHYNRAEKIHETLLSITEQTCDEYECIIIDDGSDEDQYEKVRTMIAPFKKIYLEKRIGNIKGANTCRNQGAIKAKGSHVMFLDSDDLLDPYCIENRLRASHNYPEMDMIIFKMGRFTHKINKSCSIVNKHLEETDPSRLLKNFLSFHLPWPITAPLWKLDFFKTVKFDESLLRFQDVDIHINALFKSHKIKCYPHQEVDCYYRESIHHANADLPTLKAVFENGMYLINKWRELLKEDERRYLTGLLLFLAHRYSDIMTYKLNRSLNKTYFSLGNRRFENLNAELAIFLSYYRFNKLPFINYFRKRFFYFGKKPFLLVKN